MENHTDVSDSDSTDKTLLLVECSGQTFITPSLKCVGTRTYKEYGRDIEYTISEDGEKVLVTYNNSEKNEFLLLKSYSL